MIAAVGDLVEDVVVHLHTSTQIASDTPATIIRRRGGSAANMAVSVTRCAHPARFIGQLGDDALGDTLAAALRFDHVDVVGRRGGRSGSIVVLLDEAGERTMLTDRGSCGDLADPETSWLDGVDALHVPVYSLVGGRLAETAATLIGWAHERGIAVSIDASSASVIDQYGAGSLMSLLARLRPDVLFCNELEAERLGVGGDLSAAGAGVVIVKHGAGPAELLQRGFEAVFVDADPMVDVSDTTGAGDAFAAGYLVATTEGAAPIDAVRRAHTSAAAAIRRASDDVHEPA